MRRGRRWCARASGFCRNVVASQIAHAISRMAEWFRSWLSREHLKAIVPVVRQALTEAGETYQSIDAIAVTQGPGLRALCWWPSALPKHWRSRSRSRLIAVNHLEGHIHAVLLEQRQMQQRRAEMASCIFPCSRWVVSGGAHATCIWRSCTKNLWTYRNIGHTRDDAAGEAFDKVAKLLGAGLSRSPIIDRLAPAWRSAGGEIPSFADQARGPARSQGKAMLRE